MPEPISDPEIFRQIARKLERIPLSGGFNQYQKSYQLPTRQAATEIIARLKTPGELDIMLDTLRLANLTSNNAQIHTGLIEDIKTAIKQVDPDNALSLTSMIGFLPPAPSNSR